jgi:hypothetical protein
MLGAAWGQRLAGARPPHPFAFPPALRLWPCDPSHRPRRAALASLIWVVVLLWALVCVGFDVLSWVFVLSFVVWGCLVWVCCLEVCPLVPLAPNAALQALLEAEATQERRL